MNSMGIVFCIALIICVIIGFRPVGKYLKNTEKKNKNEFNVVRQSSSNPELELTYNTCMILAILIEIMEALFLICGIYFLANYMRNNISSDVITMTVVLTFIIMCVNVKLKEMAFNKGKWLTKYTHKRIFFFLPILGGYILQYYVKHGD